MEVGEMTVGELIEQLKKFPPDALVFGEDPRDDRLYSGFDFQQMEVAELVNGVVVLHVGQDTLPVARRFVAVVSLW